MTTNRESGYYWVQRNDRQYKETARWSLPLRRWHLIGYASHCLDTDFTEIGPRIEEPRNG